MARQMLRNEVADIDEIVKEMMNCSALYGATLLYYLFVDKLSQL